MRVLFSGYYGFGNLGDEALLAGILGELDAQVTVLSQRPRDTRALHGVGAAHLLTGLAALWRCDALVSGGGGLLQDKTSARSLRYYLGVIALAKRLGKRVIVYGQSVGPLSAAGERAVAQTLRGVPVAVRDGASQRLLERLEVASVLVADPALLLPVPAASVPEDAPVLFIPRRGLPETTAAFAQVAHTLHAAGIPIAGLALQEDEDNAALEHLAETVPALKRLWASTPQAALEHVASSRYIVSARLHGLIFASLTGCPFSGVAYDPKVSAFLEVSGRPAHPVQPDPDALLFEIYQPHFDAARAGILKARAADGLGWLRHELNR